MKKLIYCLILLYALPVFSRDVNVDGYTKSNGTYVAPYVRSAPDSTRANNYGSPSSYSTGTYDRDSDNDGSFNQYDNDDDNDGTEDDEE